MSDVKTPSVSERGSYIGGSEAASVLGLNQYNPIYDVWYKKVHNVKTELDNKHIHRGNYVEPLIEQAVKDIYDSSLNSPENFFRHDAGIRKLRERGDVQTAKEAAQDHAEYGDQIFLRHPDYPIIGGHPDGVGDEILWEFKAPTMRSLEYIQKDGIKISWFYQVQHYLLCTGLEIGKVAIWDYDNWEPWIITFEADPDLQERMVERYTEFWEDVQLGVPPLALNEFHHDQVNVISDEKLDEMLAQYRRAYEWRYYGKDRQKKLKGKILSVAGDRKTLITDNFRASISEVDRGSYSYTRLTVKDKE